MKATELMQSPTTEPQARKTYQKPQLVEYGRVEQMTRSGTSAPGTVEDAIYFTS